MAAADLDGIVHWAAGLRAARPALEAIDFDKAELKVVERADRHNAFGAPNSAAGERAVPITPTVLAELRRWKLACPKGPLGLVFPNGAGNVEDLANMVGRGWKPAQIAAGARREIHGPSCDPAFLRKLVYESSR
jgi:hypothetical protein